MIYNLFVAVALASANWDVKVCTDATCNVDNCVSGRDEGGLSAEDVEQIDMIATDCTVFGSLAAEALSDPNPLGKCIHEPSSGHYFLAECTEAAPTPGETVLEWDMQICVDDDTCDPTNCRPAKEVFDATLYAMIDLGVQHETDDCQHFMDKLANEHGPTVHAGGCFHEESLSLMHEDGGHEIYFTMPECGGIGGSKDEEKKGNNQAVVVGISVGAVVALLGLSVFALWYSESLCFAPKVTVEQEVNSLV